MYQGRPRPRGGTLFHEPNFYTSLPKEGYAVGFGIDLAYTAKSSADWSICLEMWRVGACDDPQAKFYVVGVDRAQVEAPSFALTLKARSVRRPGARMLWRASGTERGSATFLKAQGIPIVWAPPPGDKFVSATAVAAAWNDGRVLVPDPEEFPESKRWLTAFLQSIDDFTGVGDEQDDDVDALGNAHKLMTAKKGTAENDDATAGSARRPERLV
jgi:phage terminase large subunit-like protein